MDEKRCMSANLWALPILMKAKQKWGRCKQKAQRVIKPCMMKQTNKQRQTNNSKRYPPTLPIVCLNVAFSLPLSCISSLSATSKQNNRCFSSQIKNCHQQTIQNAFFPPCERKTTANKKTSLENMWGTKTKTLQMQTKGTQKAEKPKWSGKDMENTNQ